MTNSEDSRDGKSLPEINEQIVIVPLVKSDDTGRTAVRLGESGITGGRDLDWLIAVFHQ